MAQDNEKKNLSELGQESGFFAEFWEFLKENKKFWMIPILLILLLLGLLIILGGTGAAPFIYALF
ncbi:MAG: hypothetical protein A2X49_02945 [Lentisphaerae bacterium GWF2_52_8]|nr:MAG: hypothetical protein A2X49_02945 [Lentisphaerae bacterium GWF2_52_8]